ncbi:MAG TPA: hypothetical protein VJ846_12050, partial [Sphingomicrobium sp.]|nr:hypothetical protein [Sphingomicrobium sp.]
EASTGEGVDALVSNIQSFLKRGERPEIHAARKRQQIGAQVFALCESRLRRVTLQQSMDDVMPDAWNDVVERRSDPYSLADKFLGQIVE